MAAVPAGTPIVNTAALTFEMNGSAQQVASNTVTLVSAELLDVTITAERPSLAVQSQAQVAVPFVIVNTGNGPQSFALTITGNQQGVVVDRVARDGNGDGAFQTDTDPLLTPPSVRLAPGEQVRIFVLVDGAQVAAAAAITATVSAQSGSGAAGTVFAGAGANGADAVVGVSGARASATSTLSPAGPAQPSLAKAQTVTAPDGSSRAMRGAVITYTLVATLPGPTRGVTIDDPIPAGTAYLADSLALDAVALSDRADADPGTADAAGVHIRLGDLAAAGSHTIQFSVKIL
ncbi:hypothetical protein EAH76_02570 [Sphingomonas glacialis]|uniref:DUF11 domain-containing protein n=2 Tax=Sphingomonas glacialis TaxID=658225 RepID=A0A502G7A1_9SPHN|nr:hypothetical protein EAH76_02570 [Sphingomonas glacialis]